MVENLNMACGGKIVDKQRICTGNPVKCKMPCDYGNRITALIAQSPILMDVVTSGTNPSLIEQVESKRNGLPIKGTLGVSGKTSQPARVLEPAA